MSDLRRRLVKLEASSEAADHCRLCELIMRTVLPAAEAAELARHPRHTLEALVEVSMRLHDGVETMH